MRIEILVLAVCILFLGLTSVMANPTLDWSIETIDSDRNVGGFTSIALDSSGYPHISYHNWSDGLKYAK